MVIDDFPTKRHVHDIKLIRRFFITSRQARKNNKVVKIHEKLTSVQLWTIEAARTWRRSTFLSYAIAGINFQHRRERAFGTRLFPRCRLSRGLYFVLRRGPEVTFENNFVYERTTRDRLLVRFINNPALFVDTCAANRPWMNVNSYRVSFVRRRVWVFIAVHFYIFDDSETRLDQLRVN